MSYRPMAMAISVLGVHILGDALSPIIVGSLLDHTNKNWNLCMLLMCAWGVWAVVFYFWYMFSFFNQATFPLCET